MFSLCEKYEIRVESESGHGGFTFAFFRDIGNNNVTNNVTENGTDSSDGAINKTAIPTVIKVYTLLKEDPTQTRTALAQKTGRTVRTIQRALDQLSVEGKIKRIGSNRAGYWEVF